MSEKIEVGDRVNIFFDRVESELNVLVLYTPGGTGDSWHVKRMDGTIVDVQTYAKMVRMKTRESIGSLVQEGPSETAGLTFYKMGESKEIMSECIDNSTSPREVGGEAMVKEMLKEEESPFKK